MKKVLTKKISGTKKLVRKVLSRQSNSSHEFASQNMEQVADEEILRNELEALKYQISNLKAAINALQKETEQKDVAIANLAREKESITLDLLRTKRSNAALAQQLEDERNFYFKEKELFCHEMNECKKLKRLMSGSAIGEEKSAEEYKHEILKLKQTLNDTLEANYNLSIKFLRMKNTKTCLKTELQAMRLEHEKLQSDYKAKIENLTSELNTLVEQKLSLATSPSNKKYLQLVKQNSCLVYENLCLQLENDNLNAKLEHMKLERTRSETNSRLSYMHSNTSEHKLGYERIKDKKKVTIKEEQPERLAKDDQPQPSCSYQNVDQPEIITIFERKPTHGLPALRIIDEKSVVKKKKTRKKQEEKASNTDAVFQGDGIPDVQISIDDNSRNKIISKDQAKLALFQVSDIQSVASSDFVLFETKISRSRSLPELNSSLSHKLP